jgi:hypothetical protein
MYIKSLQLLVYYFSVPNILNVVEPQIYESGIADVAFILDTSTYSLDDDVYQNQVGKILLFYLTSENRKLFKTICDRTK